MNLDVRYNGKVLLRQSLLKELNQKDSRTWNPTHKNIDIDLDLNH